jgi:hypothetical protein
VTFGSGDSDAFTFDPNTGRMTQYKYTVNSQAEIGNLGWNANGTLGTLGITDPINPGDTQNCAYSHDLRFKTDFYKMTLKCGEKELVPIQPGKIAHVLDTHNHFINATDATYEGFYQYLPDSITPSCGQITLGLYSEKNPENATFKVLDEKTVTKIWGDFEPYRTILPATTAPGGPGKN